MEPWNLAHKKPEKFRFLYETFMTGQPIPPNLRPPPQK